MTILIFCLALVACILCWTLSRKCPKSPKRNLEFNWRETLTIMSLVLGIIAVGSVVMIVRLSIDIASESIIDKKIEMYQEENTDIEQSIDIVVEEYLKHEHDTFADLKTEESPITLVTLFPELKSDTLVQKQIEIYVANNDQIKSLKEERIDIAKLKWILYFGK